MSEAKHTPGLWRTVKDAQGPCMIMHPTREGVAIANLSSCFSPLNGYHDDWGANDGTAPVSIAERNANAHLIAAVPELYEALKGFVAACELGFGNLAALKAKASAAIAKAEGRQ